MAYCVSCGTRIDDGENFCPSCGTAINVGVKQQVNQGGNLVLQGAGTSSTASATVEKASATAEYDATDISDNQSMAFLSYLGPLWLIPFFARKRSKYVRFHCNQGLILLLFEATSLILSAIMYSIVTTEYYYIDGSLAHYTPGWLSILLYLILLPCFALTIFGIVNVAGRKAMKLPVIGKIRIIK